MNAHSQSRFYKVSIENTVTTKILFNIFFILQFKLTVFYFNILKMYFISVNFQLHFSSLQTHDPSEIILI